MIKLIINADDFGYRRLYNQMILELIEEKAVTSTSVLIDKIDTTQTTQVKRLIQYSKDHLVSVGLHLHFQNTSFQAEIDRQFAQFVSILGFEPSHVDIHKADHLKQAYPVIQQFCRRRKIACKNLSTYLDEPINLNGLITTKDPVFDGTGKSLVEIKQWLKSLSDGFHCINFHPGYYDPESSSSLNKKRETDAEMIRKITQCLAEFDIQLANFNDLAKEYIMKL